MEKKILENLTRCLWRLLISNANRLKIFAAAPGWIQNGGSCRGPAVKPSSEWMKSADPRLLSRITAPIVSLSRQDSKPPLHNQTVTIVFLLVCVAQFRYYELTLALLRWQSNNLASPMRQNGRASNFQPGRETNLAVVFIIPNNLRR